MTVAECPDDDELAAFAEGGLPAALVLHVEVHLDHCVRCQQVLSSVARALDAVHESSTLGSYTGMFSPGSEVANRYRIVRFVARGGMGEVYEAFDRELQERVALKTVISTDGDSPRAELKLKAEVQLARRISHPNVCLTYDLGVHEPGGDNPRVPFLSMEFIDGESLGHRLKSGALAQAEAGAIAAQLLAGLAAAHEAGVLHRDFKSDNVMLRRDSTAGTPQAVITDFGLARALDRPEQPRAKDSRRLVGSPAYMAPEQVMNHELGTETDVFAFGVVFFEMLTGKLPFPGENALETALNRLSQPAQAPSSQCEGMENLYDQFVLKCLSRERSRRFSDAQAALDALRVLSARTRPLRARRWGLVAGAAAACIIGLGVSGAALRADPSHSLATRVAAPESALRTREPGPTAAISAAPVQAPVASAPLAPLAGVHAATRVAAAARRGTHVSATPAAPQRAPQPRLTRAARVARAHTERAPQHERVATPPYGTRPEMSAVSEPAQPSEHAARAPSALPVEGLPASVLAPEELRPRAPARDSLLNPFEPPEAQ